MALGGGTFLIHNKVLPGTYINFVSKSKASVNISDRGYIGVCLPLNWSKQGDIITLHSDTIMKDCIKLFATSYTSDEMIYIRELFKNAKVVYLYNLNSGGTKARNTDQTIIAKYEGINGNDITVEVKSDIDDTKTKHYITRVKDTIVDYQKTKETPKNNDFVEFKPNEEKPYNVGVIKLENGSNGSVSGGAYEDFLKKIDSYYINILTTISDEQKIKNLFMEYTKRTRDEVGAKFQVVLHNVENANHEGVISVYNKLDKDLKSKDEKDSVITLWVAGALGGCDFNKSCTNKIYDGEYKIDTNITQAELIKLKQKGYIVLHKVGDDVRILSDINTFTEFRKDKNKDFSKNQTIRVLDQLAIDIANLFNKVYLGKTPNDNAGRTELWKDIVLLHETYQGLRAIENFNDKDIKVTKGEEKDQVIIEDTITPINAMEQLYMTVIVA